MTTGEGSVIGRPERGRESGPRDAPVARSGPCPTPCGALEEAPARTWSERLRREIAAQGDRLTLWVPVAFGCGCALWLGLKVEPPMWSAASAFAVALLVAALTRRILHAPARAVGLLGMALAAGFLVIDLRADRVAAPTAPAGLVSPVEGWVVDVASPSATGARVVIAPFRIDRLGAEATPERIRVTLKESPPEPGAYVRFTALLNPPPPPAAPGAYDFARDAWFQGIGGVGAALTPLRPAVAGVSPPVRLSAAMGVNAFRWRLTQRIAASAGDSGGIAAAMVTGHEALIAKEDLQAMRDSGLAHVLSISGLHMAVVGGFVFFAARLLIAAWPWLALRANGKKLSAAAGLAAVGAYLVVSGAPPPAERAAVVAAVAFSAILADRRAISLNALALAALIVLAMRPESVVQPGFQMSFAATAALVALAEKWPAAIREISAPWPIVVLQRSRDWIAAAAAASLVAGFATGPFAVQHFNRIAAYGLLANLATAPLTNFVSMPALALGSATAATPLGDPLLRAAGWALEATTTIARTVAGWPGAVRIVASAPAAALPVAFLGLLFVCLWNGRARWIGAPFALAVLLWPREAPPDVWIADDGSAAAVRQGRAALALRPEAKAFATDLWSRRRGLSVKPAEAWDCDRRACAPGEGAPLRLGAWWGRKPPSPERLAALCAASEVVTVRARVSSIPAPCARVLLLDGEDFHSGGSVELWRGDGGWRGRWSREARGDRPWVQ